MTTRNKIILVPLVSSLNEPKSVKEVVGSYTTWLGKCFDVSVGPVWTVEALRHIELEEAAGIIALVVTGGTERLIQSTAGLGRPLMILAHESMNSLPAALEAIPSLGRVHPPQVAFGQDETEVNKVKRFVIAAGALGRMRSQTVGLVGGPSPWLTYSLPNEENLERHLGVRIIAVPMQEFDEEYERADKLAVAKSAAEVRSVAPASSEVRSEDFVKSARIYAALQSIVSKHGLTSLSVRCFDFISKYQATGCLGVSILNNQGIVAGCEGDIPAAVAMITLSEVCGGPTFLANPTFIKGHKLIIAHCTIATKLTAGYRYRTHFESGLGVAISGALKEGERVTVARYSSGFDTLRAGEGTVKKGEAWSEKLCRTQAEIEMDGDAEVIKDHPMGNHLVMAYGNHIDSLHELAALADLNFERI
jgi:L-fucose isomerase-like protein